MDAIVPIASNAGGMPFSPAEAVLDPDALAELPENLEPTMSGAWSAFALLYRKIPAAKRDEDWIELMRTLRPGKLQVRFSAEDWREVIDRVRKMG